MKLRGKLLILFLGIALTPLSIITYRDQNAFVDLGQELAAQSQTALTQVAHHLLHRIAADYARVVLRERQLLEQLVRTQVTEVERHLAAPPPLDLVLYGPADFDVARPPALSLVSDDKYYRLGPDGRRQPLQVSYQHPVTVMPAGVAAAPAGEATRLLALTPFLRETQHYHGDLVYEQFAALENGLYMGFPGHGGLAPAYDPRATHWYVAQKARQSRDWPRPVVDPSTQQVFFTVTQPIRDLDGKFLGVTGLSTPFSAFLNGLDLPSQWAAELAVYVVSPTGVAPRCPALGATDQPSCVGSACPCGEAGSVAGGGTGMRVLARQIYEKPGGFRSDVTVRALLADRVTEMGLVLEDMRSSTAGIRKVRYQGEDTFWAYSRMDGRDTSRLFIVPHRIIVAPAVANYAESLRHTEGRMGISVAFFAVVVIAASFLAYVGGQRILSSIWALTAAARQIGQRNFDLRVVIESGDEFEELARAFNEMVPELSERARIGETLQVAREVQQHLLPGAAPQIPGLDVAGQTEFCDETGGDYYDFLDLEAVEPGLIAVAVGDVAGHGIPSALLMTTVRALLHGFARERHTPASLLNAVNPLLVKDVHHGRFMSLFYLLADGGQRQFQWVSAGHGPAFRYNRHSRIWDELEGTDIPLGVEKDWRFGPTLHTDWRAGDVLLLATDGIWETRGEMQRRFGMTRLRAVVEDCAAGSAASICAHVMEALKDFRGKVAPSDDMTLVVVKVLEEGDEVAV